MRVLSLHIQNFLSHVDTTIYLDNLGVVLIDGENRDRGGSNGAGKTTLIEALYWCFYGQLLRDIKLADLSYKGKGSVAVTAKCLLEDGTNALIQRTHGHKTLPPVTLQTNAVGVEAGTIAETQRKINALVRMDARTFKHVVLFAADTVSFASLTDKGQKEILDAILGLDRLPKAYAKVAEQLKNFQLLRQGVDNLVTQTAFTVKQCEMQVKHLRASEAGFQNSKILAEKKALQHVVALQAKQPNVDPADTLKLKSLKSRQADLALLLAPVKFELQETLSKLMQARQERGKLEQSIQLAEERIKAFQPFDVSAALKASSDCPACKQSLPKKAVENLRKTYERQAQEALHEIEHQKNHLNGLKTRMLTLNGDIARLQEHYSGHQETESEYQRVSLEVARLEGKILAATQAYKHWREQLDAANRAADDAARMTSPYGLLLDAEGTRLKEALQTLENAKAEQAKRDEEQAYLEFWRLGYSNKGVKGLLLDTVTPFLNERANEYAKILTSGTARIEFITHYRNEDDELKEKFDVSAAYNYGAATYDGVSTGERRRLDLACLFALGDLAQARSGATIRLRLLDEPFGPLDAVGQEQVLKLLNVLAERLGTVLVTSHENEIRALIEKRITVVKEYGVSRVAA